MTGLWTGGLESGLPSGLWTRLWNGILTPNSASMHRGVTVEWTSANVLQTARVHWWEPVLLLLSSLLFCLWLIITCIYLYKIKMHFADVVSYSPFSFNQRWIWNIGSSSYTYLIRQKNIKLGTWYNWVTVPPESMDPFAASLPQSSGKVKPRFFRRTT